MKINILICKIMSIKELYSISKSAKIGEQCKCPSCGTVFIKENYQQAFCKTKNGTACKDKYWNTVTPEKRNNTARISPASANYMIQKSIQRNSRVRITSEGYSIRNGIAYDEFDNPVYRIDKNEDSFEHGQWND